MDWIGCKFKHEASKDCTRQEKCNYNLCQYQHKIGGEIKGKESNKVWKCKELNWNDEPCTFQSAFNIRFQNHMIAYHEIGGKHICDYCVFSITNRKELKKHIEDIHGENFLTCDGNCNDRLYEENSFTCDKCKDFACTICGKADTADNPSLDPKKSYCYGCV